MLKALIKSTNEVRLETIEDVKTYQEMMRKEANDNNFQLATYSWTEKYTKSGGEIVETYYQVKYTFVFNDLKSPETYLNSIKYNMVETDQQEF